MYPTLVEFGVIWTSRLVGSIYNYTRISALMKELFLNAVLQVFFFFFNSIVYFDVLSRENILVPPCHLPGH